MPGEFDGYVTDTRDGRFEAAMAGRIIDVFDEEQDAVDAVRGRAGGRVCWRVALDGEARPLELA